MSSLFHCIVVVAFIFVAVSVDVATKTLLVFAEFSITLPLESTAKLYAVVAVKVPEP